MFFNLVRGSALSSLPRRLSVELCVNLHVETCDTRKDKAHTHKYRVQKQKPKNTLFYINNYGRRNRNKGFQHLFRLVPRARTIVFPASSVSRWQIFGGNPVGLADFAGEESQRMITTLNFDHSRETRNLTPIPAATAAASRRCCF